MVRRTAISLCKRLRQCRLMGGIGSSKDIILVYHSVGEDKSSNLWGNISEEEFRQHIGFFSRCKEVVSLAELKKKSDRQRVALTFDDGLCSFYNTALPILERHEIPATVFVCPSLSWGEDRSFRERHKIKKEGRIIMSGKEIEDLGNLKNIEIGNHTFGHVNLGNIHDTKEIEKQIVGSKLEIEKRCKCKVKSFSFPYGGYNSKSLKVVKENHDLSVWGGGVLVSNNESMHMLPRCNGHVDLDEIKYFMSYTSHIINKIENKFK